MKSGNLNITEYKNVSGWHSTSQEGYKTKYWNVIHIKFSR